MNGVVIDGPERAPVLVLANSLGTTARMWEPQIQTLAGHFRVVRYEHPGHGGAPAPPGPYDIADLGRDLLAVLDDVGVERAAVCGLSLGGMAAMWLAGNRPDRVSSLVLCCTGPELGGPGPWEARAAAVRAGGTLPLLDLLLPRWFRDGGLGRPALVEVVSSMLAAVDAQAYAACCAAIGAADLTDTVRRITAPTLVIGGALDPVVPPAAALHLASLIPGAALTVVADAAHLANLDQPERFGDAVLGHLLGPAPVRGEVRRRAALGDEHVDRALASQTPLTAPFQDLIGRYAWGEVWSRPGLDARTRSCITIAMLVATNRPDELALHVRRAAANGVSDAELGEVLLQTAIYCGVPAANAAFAVASRALEEHLPR